MPQPVLLTLSILAIAVVLFITERLSIDLVALLVLGALALTGLVTAEEALAGFSSPAVVTVWAVFILSAGLARTGVAGWIGRQITRLGGRGEMSMLLVIMLVSAFLSAFMNNMGVTALLLPVALDIARRTNRPPSKLLIPLAFSSSLGGMLSMIGTPANILAAEALDSFGFEPFKLFDFAPIGLVVGAAGLLFLLTTGHKLLPARDPARELRHDLHEMGEAFAIEERLFTIAIPPGSPLDDCPLSCSHLGSVLGLNVIGIRRGQELQLSPAPETPLRAGDKLFVSGRLDKLLNWQQGEQLRILDPQPALEHLQSEDIHLAAAEITSNASLLGSTLPQLNFRQKYGSTVLSVWHDGQLQDEHIETYLLQPGDRLLLQATRQQLEQIRGSRDFSLLHHEQEELEQLQRNLMLVEVPPGSSLCNTSIAESHLGDAYNLGVLGILRQEQTLLMPAPEETILPGDRLLIKGRMRDMEVLLGLQRLVIDDSPALAAGDLESPYTATVEAVLAPQSSLHGKTLRGSNFRERYNLSVLAIWRGGRPWRFNLRDMQLRFGDALLIFGRRENLRMLAQDPEFLVLNQQVQPAPRLDKTPIAAALMLAMVAAVGFGLLPISLASIITATLMVLTGCLSMNEAYGAIQWRAVFLIAGMLPLGTAMQATGTAQYLADFVSNWTQHYGITVQLAGLFLLTSLASQVMPNPVVVVLMAPVALNMAANQGLSPYALMMLLAVSASASIITPIGHPSNVLVMGPGGYKFTDYLKVGVPLVVIVMLVTLLALPLFWPLY